MLLSRSKSSLSDPEALPSFLNHNPISFKENEKGRVHPSLPQLEQSRSSVEILHPSTGVSQTVYAMSNPSASSTNSQSTSTPSHATSTDLTPNNPIPRFLHTSSSRPSSRQHIFPSQKRRILRSGYNSEPDMRSVASRPSSQYSISGATEVPYQKQWRSSQHGTIPTLARPRSAIFPAEGRFDAVDATAGSSWTRSHAELLHGATAIDQTRDLPPIPAGNEYAPSVVRHPSTFSNQFDDVMVTLRPKSSRTFSATVQDDAMSEVWSANLPDVKLMADSWSDDARGVLLFVGSFCSLVSSFIITTYARLTPDISNQDPLHPCRVAGGTLVPPVACPPSHPSTAIVCVVILWLMALVFAITSALFATMTLHWSRRYAQSPQGLGASGRRARIRSSFFPGIVRYSLHHAVATTVTLLHVAVFLFLTGLVVFFFTIYATVGIVVSILVGIVGTVYLTLTVLTYFDHDTPYRTPLSRVWWSRQEGLGYKS